VPDWQPLVSEITSFEFRDFDSFREHLHGWDTDPVQLDAGPLRLRWDQLRLEDFGLARLQVNRRIADTSAVEPGVPIQRKAKAESAANTAGNPQRQ
jgi:hypothetical protein